MTTGKKIVRTCRINNWNKMQHENMAEEKLTNQEEVNASETIAEEKQDGNTSEREEAKLQAELAEQKEKYLRLYSDFENFRRRSSKEKLDLIKSAGEEIIVSLLPVLDDLERALSAHEKQNVDSVLAEGTKLIYNKLYKTLEQKGLKPIEAKGKEFDIEQHDAITQYPAADESQKGKVIEEVEKGYFLNDKVIRFAKVVIGA
jgi:molecular chaperone GrpE